ncbi:hypothetical protein PIB30_041203 [Stylosanthes scabra]|uniref:Uncharacterized protein n=1 Tax=Stylosanthes scabra TaxID=79078 RepID=A0ABU6ZDK4_9FABA|nr:hypothetical protein [Stylosanthes scabra]
MEDRSWPLSCCLSVKEMEVVRWRQRASLLRSRWSCRTLTKLSLHDINFSTSMVLEESPIVNLRGKGVGIHTVKLGKKMSRLLVQCGERWKASSTTTMFFCTNGSYRRPWNAECTDG